MSQKFQASVQHRGDMSFVKLGGVIDEDNELSDLVEKIPSGTAVIDLGEIERINSCGVRDWVNWLSKLETNGTRSVLVECSPAIVAQINLVNNFTGNGVVKSFYVPYFCPECDEEKVLLVEASDMGPPPHEPPTCRCDECDLVMDFDDMPDSYFAFLSNQRKIVEPERINGAMRDLGRGSNMDNGKGKVRSRASQPNLSSGSGPGSGPGVGMGMGMGMAAKPSVPSLPSIQRASNQGHPSYQAAMQSGLRSKVPSVPPGRPQLSSKPPTGPGSGAGLGGGGGMGMGVGMGGSPSRPMGVLPSGNMQALPGQGYGYGQQSVGPSAAPPRSNTLVLVLIGILLVAISVLVYLVATK